MARCGLRSDAFLQGIALIAALWFFGVRPAAAAVIYRLDVTQNGDRYQAEAAAHLDATPAAVHAALLAFPHYTEFSPAIVKAALIRRIDDHHWIVYVEIRGCILIFCRTLRLRLQITDLAARGIVATTLASGSNVRSASDSWQMVAEGRGTHLIWNSVIVPDFWVPPVIGPALIRYGLEKLGGSFLKGIERFAAGPSVPTPLSHPGHRGRGTGLSGARR